jgi:hypothetical protein
MIALKLCLCTVDLDHHVDLLDNLDHDIPPPGAWDLPA